MIDRYSRQILFPGIGKEGQEKLEKSAVLLIGCGALGTAIASTLARAGVGKLRIVDRDFIEYHNLQRQILFDEEDIRGQLPKAVAAERHLRAINSSIEIEGIVADVNYSNIEKFVEGADLILDGLDNFEARFLINDAAMKHRLPWVYGGAISSTGMMANIIPGQTPCFRCLYPEGPSGQDNILTCDTAGVIGSAPTIVASMQATEAIKILVGAKSINRDLVYIDVWDGIYRRFKFNFREGCPCCQGKYEFLDARFGTRTTSLCGQNAVQVLNPVAGKMNLNSLAERLKRLGQVNCSEFMLRFTVDNHEMVIFPDGRAIVKNTNDVSVARGLYAKYIGI